MTHNPSAQIQFEVSKEEREYLFSSLTYHAGIVFPLPKAEDWLILSDTFNTTSLMASSCTFNLAVLALASLYRGLNEIAYAMKPSYFMVIFPEPLSLWVACTLFPNSSCVAFCPSESSGGARL